MIDSIFVYGTLKRRQLRASLWPCKPISVQPAIIRAELYDTGPFPAILVGQDNVLGELWTFEQRNVSNTLHVLDEVEGFDASRRDNLYIRIETDVILEGGMLVRAFVYQYAQPGRPTSMRRIAPYQEFDGHLCATWPDAIARVPKCFTDE